MSRRVEPVDQRDRDRIAADLESNLLVEAGAGSGKTHEMAARMAAGVASGHYEIEQMAAVTFTRKAAAELRGRFQLALEAELLREGPLGNKQKFTRDERQARHARIEAALSSLERFFAGTIHAFCAHLLRERPVEAGVSPGFTELDEIEDGLVRKQAWHDFIAHARATGNPWLLELRDAGLKLSELDQAFEIVCNDEDVEFPPGDGQRPDVEAAWKALDRFWADLGKLLPKDVSADTTCPTQRAARRFARQLRIARTQRDRAAVVAQLLEMWDFGPGITQKWWADSGAEKKRLRDAVVALHETFRATAVDPFIDQWRQYLYRLVVTLLTQARGGAGAERRRRNTLNYNDLLLLAAKVLRENAGVRLALQRKYRWLFVDEFQDTDPVQAEIIFLLAAAEPEPSAPGEDGRRVAAATPSADWRKLPLRPGALFVVGDPKQSIYRFRRADIEIYNRVRHRLESAANGDVVSLTTNFRSVPALCGWANAVFSSKFPAAPTPQSPQFAGLSEHRDPQKGTGAFTLTIPAAVAGADVADHEAELIARYIRSAVDARRRVWGDFLILTRKRRQRLLPYVQALEALQIPMEVSGAGAFADSQEVKDLALLLRALSDPQDAVSLVGVLRGPLFGISDPELFAWKQSGGWFSLFADVPGGATPAPASLKNVSAALQALSQYFHWTRMLPAGTAIEKILEHCGTLALAATTPDGVDAGDLLHAIDRVRQVAETGGSLADAAASLEADLDTAGDVESLPLEPGRSDVVRLMNLHKAKGLEAAVVFLADPTGAPRARVDRRITREGDTPRGWFSIQRERDFRTKVLAQPKGWEDHVLLEQAFLDAEETRLLYVAATRARDLLVVGRYAKDGKGRPWAALDPFLGKAPELPVPSKVKPPQAQKADLSLKSREKAASARQGAHARAQTPTWSATSVTAEAAHIAKMARAAQPVAADDATRVVVQDTASHRADAGMAWGTLVHGLLEHAMRHQHATREDLRRLAMWLTVEEPKLRTVLDEAINVVQRVAQAEFWRQAVQSEHSVETPFAVLDASKKLLSGGIDLMFKSGEAWQVVDYKTDAGQSDRLAIVYREQLKGYERALVLCGLRALPARLAAVG